MIIPPWADMSQISEPMIRFVEQTHGLSNDTRFESLVDAVAKRIAFMVDTSQAEGSIKNLKKLIDTLGD